MVKKEIKYFLTALSFFTRFPVGSAIDYSQESLNRCNRYFPLIGLITGGVAALSYLAFSLILPLSVSLLLSMLLTILFTGAFHEDGFADMCDGFGGGWRKEQILNIMKDSRIGTYGSIGLMGMLAAKYLSLYELRHIELWAVMTAGHIISRTLAVTTMYSLEYVREDEASKSKPITKNLHPFDLTIALATGITLILLHLFVLDAMFLAAIIPAIIVKWLMERWFVKHIGGYTGDCLGAVQQSTEVIFYISAVALLY